MKLKKSFIAQEIDGIHFLVPAGGEAFHGIVRSNKTAAFIIECLKKETTPEQIVDAMCSRYKAPADTVAADVEEILDSLRSIGALEE